jgi:NADH-quinone oxidoreductase subunit M
MASLEFPWITLLLAVSTVGALVASRLEPEHARRFATGCTLLSVALSLGAFASLPEAGLARDPLDPLALLGLRPCWALDELSALLLPFGAALFALTTLTLPRLRTTRHWSVRLLAAEAVTLATFACQNDIVLGVLWVVGLLPLEAELRAAQPERSRGVRLYMAVSVLLVAAGLVAARSPEAPPALPSALLLAAVMIRKGIVPLHSWMPALFERIPIPAAVLFTTPQIGTYFAARLIAPSAPSTVLAVLGTLSLITAVYAAGVALVQVDGRRAVGWLFMSQSALVLAGLECTSVTGLAGAYSLWISSSLSLAGFGMTLCVLDARRGRISLDRHWGGYESTPMLATSFLLLGLCTVGFPGTLGFVGAELLLDGSVQAHPWVGVATVVASVLNGITVVRMFIRLFCGVPRPFHPELRLRPREHAAFLILVMTLVLGGIFPQSIVFGRGRAAERIMEERQAISAHRVP